MADKEQYNVNTIEELPSGTRAATPGEVLKWFRLNGLKEKTIHKHYTDKAWARKKKARKRANASRKKNR